MDSTPLRLTDSGLFCEAGDFHVDPWRPVDRAVITHAHADHATWGCGRYLTSKEGSGVLKIRMGRESVVDSLDYGESIDLNGVRVSLHPAGHILGSSQIRIESKGHVCVVSGDYKTEPDPTCSAFEPIRCHSFLSESTFGLPIYRWPTQSLIFDDVNAWWRANAETGRSSLLLGYALGKAQRLLAGLDPSIGPIACHGAVEKLNGAYRDAGVALPPTTYAAAERGKDWAGTLIVAPPSALGTPWMRRFGDVSTGFASGWMTIRGPRRRKGVDRGFVLSDHVDWPSLLGAIEATGADHIYVTHGYSDVVVRYLRDRGKDAHVIATRYEGETESGGIEAEASEDER